MSNILKTLAAGSASEPTDEYFNQTTLLLHGDGTNGAQNNTFLDSSTNNFTITRNGNTTQGTFSPFSVADGEWSNYFDGSGDYLRTPTNVAFDYSTGDFTVECWFNLSAKTAGQAPIAQLPSGSDGAWRLSVQDFSNNDKVNLVVRVSGNWVDVFNISQSWSLGVWYHLAIARSGTTLKAFVNGSEVGSTTFSSQFGGSSYATDIGYLGNDNVFFTGYVSNVRTVKGTAVYTSAFTPPTAPLTAIANTSLLACQSNRFKDNSTNNFAITVNGNPSVQPFSPFAPSAAYYPSVNGGSGYFDGSGDYLAVPDDADFDLASGTNWTIEGWIYKLTTGSQYFIGSNTAAGFTNFSLGINASNQYQFFWVKSPGETSGDVYSIASSSTAVLNQWNHVAAVNNSGTVTLYVNGSSVGTVSISGQTYVNRATGIGIGSSSADTGSALFNGYVSDARMVVGTAVYTAAFTPPTAPLTAVTNTSLLCNFTNAGIFDNTGKNNLETVGNAQIDTTTKKYGTGSMEFDGTGDYLAISNNESFGFTGDFTCEAWIYPTIVSGLQNIFSTENIDFKLSGNVIRIYTTSGSNSTGTINANEWTFVTLCRSGSTFYVSINGTVETVTPANFTSDGSSAAEVGRRIRGTNEPFNGYIDDLRITKGVARYTANFTPPDKAFPNQ